ncbi:hypothetical protein HF888_04355 [Bermanella marisrubri]|uniref:Uncharacterized protein n=1 Tax=Bermanella marisrubri TaxID=207949 RepID=Q1N1M3_9GAMM|nr:hypothetical protein [Bermanella marisrubri]EAT12027.1 hypothetical protein RED65_03275 [Oceanobacter sp. RED65] [Bermanella marisrubri]QIZ83500.1 hypothetical protein HF888_04355 [Bermanella marisrubri]
MKWLIVLAMTFLTMHTSASDLIDNYYSNDINTAVNTARERPHHYDYSTTYRYKRTTAQSIELKKLNLDELDETRLKMSGNLPEQNTAINNENNTIALENDQRVEPQQSSTSDIPSAILPKAINPIYSGQTLQGQMSTQGILQAGSVTSTPRP